MSRIGDNLWKRGIVFSLLVGLLATCTVFWSGCAQKEKPVLTYWTVSEEPETKGLSKQMVVRVMISTETLPSDEMMQDTALHIWENGNKDWNRFTVFMYLPDMDPHNFAYGVGEFADHKLEEFHLNPMATEGTRWRPLIVQRKMEAKAKAAAKQKKS